MGETIDDFTSISVKGSFTLFVGNTIALIVNAAGVILVARMLSPSEYGLYSITLVLPSFFLLFSDWGINAALTRFVAQYRSQNRQREIDAFIKSGTYFKFILGLFLSIVLFLSANYLSGTALLRPEVGALVRLASILILSQSIHNTMISIFTGYERMEKRATLTVIQSIVKGVGSPLLVYLGYGVSGAVIGHTLSYVVSSIVGYILALTLSQPGEEQVGSLQMSLRTMLRYGLPLLLGGILVGFTGQFQGFLLSWFVSTEVIGNYNVALWFITLVSVFSSSIHDNLLPAFSKLNFADDPAKGEELFRGSVRYSTMFLLPFVFLLMTVSKPAVLLLFGGKYPQAPIFLALRMMPFLFIGLGSLSVVSFLNSQGETKASMRINAITTPLTVILLFIFIRQWSVTGLIAAFTLSSLVKSLMGLYVIRRMYGIAPSYKHSLKTFVSCVVSGSLACSYMYFFSIAPLADLLISTAIFLTTYLIVAPIIGAIRTWDIKTLDAMLRNLKIIYPLTRPLLGIIEKVIRATSRTRADMV